MSHFQAWLLKPSLVPSHPHPQFFPGWNGKEFLENLRIHVVKRTEQHHEKNLGSQSLWEKHLAGRLAVDSYTKKVLLH